MKIKKSITLFLLLAGWVNQSLAGGILLERTRVVYNDSKKEAALSVTNQSDKLPYLLQSWVENGTNSSRGPFIITPPLFRLDAGDNSSLRIIKTDGNLPSDKESLFYINVRAIPAVDKNENQDSNLLTLVFKTRIKLFFRPANLKGRPSDAYKGLQFTRKSNQLDIYNPSAYYVVFSGLAVGKTVLTDKIEFISPGEHKQLPLPLIAENTVKWAAINDYGGNTDTYTSTLQ
ncbi:molecular chaperone [Escherichia coli]|uniref:fimbrial biogenesis chaperone n=1 Tax=Escherichia sp. MOD1-EC7003 TaxID=2093900 RepID=UPI000CF779A1|nr:molecular chaperone [Escherichia sp. MOD1-EC7003]MCH0693521.1 molecular chaperone [Escherichia coli]